MDCMPIVHNIVQLVCSGCSHQRYFSGVNLNSPYVDNAVFFVIITAIMHTLSSNVILGINTWNKLVRFVRA